MKKKRNKPRSKVRKKTAKPKTPKQAGPRLGLSHLPYAPNEDLYDLHELATREQYFAERARERK